MTSTPLSDLLARLEAIKGSFGKPEALRIQRLLTTLGRHTFPDAHPLIRFHEALMFLLAFPQTPAIRRQVDALLTRFAIRVDALREAGADLSPLDPLEVSGIAGTVIEDKLNYDVTRWLSQRSPAHVDAVWDDEAAPLRLGATLPRFVPLLDDDAYVEADVPYGAWLAAAHGSRNRLAWLLSQFARLSVTGRERTELFDSLDLTIRWNLGNLRASRTRNWRAVRQVSYHDAPFIRRNDVDLRKEITAPIRLRRLSRREGEQTLDFMREIMTVRRRELWGTTHGDPAQVVAADVGRGLTIFLWGLPPERRLPLRAYLAGFGLKNGVPINYVEAIGLGDWMEVGFNTFYTFRDGESAWNYAQALRCLHRLTGMTCVSVYPFQIGLGNDEAIESGAFWFYRKLGFRPERADVREILAREERKIAARPGYRTPPSTLRKLAAGNLFFELPGTAAGLWDTFRTRNIGFKVQRWIARKCAGDSDLARRRAAAALARVLGERREAWAGDAGRVFTDFALVLALVPDLGRWSVEEKDAIGRIIRTKAAWNEWGFLRLLQSHSRLKTALIKLGTSPPR
ncbi:MAG TPA: hypothetical protein VMD08_14455 [Candidatus Baltobacteraceae bacterium]|nr:hypothetical protein [Candidatus Baltobacteraceae bacterium]